MDDQSLEKTENDVRARLQRDLSSTAVDSYARYRAGAIERTRSRRRSLQIAGALVGGIAVIVLAVLTGSTLANLRRNAAASPPPALPSPAASVPAATSALPSAIPTPLPSGRPTGGIEAYPLGPLHGEYAFVLNGGATTTAGAVAEVWAIPLAGGAPRLAARFVNATTPATSTGDNVLARQLSPDGQQVVLSVATERSAGGEHLSLFIVDIETGRTTPVGLDDAADRERPAWSPDGRSIAFIKRPIPADGRGGNLFDDGIWLVNVDGGGPHRIIAPGSQGFGSAAQMYGWTADGRVGWSYGWPATLTLTNPTSGVETQIGKYVGDFRGFSSRATAPRLAGSFSDSMNCPGSYVLVGDGAPERVLVRAPDRPQCPLRIHHVRWNPTRDEVLYVLESATNELHVVELSGATHRIAAQADAVLAEWSVDGAHLLYIRRTAQDQLGQFPFRGGELRYTRRDGSDDRAIFTPPGIASLSDIAVRTYR